METERGEHGACQVEIELLSKGRRFRMEGDTEAGGFVWDDQGGPPRGGGVWRGTEARTCGEGAPHAEGAAWTRACSGNAQTWRRSRKGGVGLASGWSHWSLRQNRGMEVRPPPPGLRSLKTGERGFRWPCPGTPQRSSHFPELPESVLLSDRRLQPRADSCPPQLS